MTAPTAPCIAQAPKAIDFIGPAEPLNATFQARKREYVVPPLIRKLR